MKILKRKKKYIVLTEKNTVQRPLPSLAPKTGTVPAPEPEAVPAPKPEEPEITADAPEPEESEPIRWTPLPEEELSSVPDFFPEAGILRKIDTHLKELEAGKQDEAEGTFSYEGSRRTNFLLVLAILLGSFLLLYPSAADYWNNFHQSRMVASYMERVANLDAAEYAKAIGAAEDYNYRLSQTGIQWDMSEEQRKEYLSLLDLAGTGVMGYIDVPKINIKLPLYHGTDQEILQISIGHLEQTSLPVGGPGSHCSLSGHRGLPSAKLFSDLGKVTEGDTFTLSILNETYTYEVDQIRVVLPESLDDLEIEKGQDLCTLITCTPYGVNSHRMLVRGHRVKNLNGNAKVVADAMQLDPRFVSPFLMLPMVLGLLVLLFAGNPVKKK